MIEIQDKVLSGLKFIDLFAGLGGFRLAMDSLGAECVFTSEWDFGTQQVYMENFGDRPAGDITLIDENLVPDHDILCAGFPCQAFSISGKRMGFEDSRGTLFFDVARIVKAKRPRVVFMENVRNFESHDDGRTLAVVKSTMEELGYTFNARVLSAVNYGVPQVRERIFMVCFREAIDSTAFRFPEEIPLMKFVEDCLIDESLIPDELYVDYKVNLRMVAKFDDVYSEEPIRLGTVNGGCQGERIYSPKGTAITLTAYGGGRYSRTGGYLIQGRVRRLHVRECARLTGFPDTYKLDENVNKAYRQLGNTVIVDVLQYIGLEIGKVLQEK